MDEEGQYVGRDNWLLVLNHCFIYLVSLVFSYLHIIL
jgi:hypothetical protein